MRDVEQERAGVLLLFLLAGDAASRKNSQADFGLEGFDTQNGKNPASTQNTGEGGFKQAQDTNNGPIVQDGRAETFGQIFGTQTDDGAKVQVSVDGQESSPSAENNNASTQANTGDVKSVELDWDKVVNKKGETRVEHVNKHGVEMPNKKRHGVFNGDPIEMTRQAWKLHESAVPIDDGTGRIVYIIPYKNAGYESGYLNTGE